MKRFAGAGAGMNVCGCMLEERSQVPNPERRERLNKRSLTGPCWGFGVIFCVLQKAIERFQGGN